KIQLVATDDPRNSALAHSALTPPLHVLEQTARRVAIHRLPRVEMRELREADGNHRGRNDGVAHVPEILQRLFEDCAVVQTRNDHHLAVELDSTLAEPGELLDDVRNLGIVENYLARLPVGRVDRDVEGRQAVLQDALDVALL